ncbi:hypothetical protein [Marinoscillum sp.]|uniref:hypothetical protein n=1 Tax=Marinoscillum sp. TaxID=2024838 RepID=UPI003BAB0C20
MMQSEKKDIILKYLYQHKDDGCYYNIEEILTSNSISSNYVEIDRLANDLSLDKLIYLKNLSSKLKKGKISSKGIDYCEKTSYEIEGRSIIYNINNSPQANIVVNSTGTTITQHEIQKANDLIRQINTELEKVDIEVSARRDINECLAEIVDGLNNQTSPKFAIRSLISLVSDVATISGLAIQLSEIFTN